MLMVPYLISHVIQDLVFVYMYILLILHWLYIVSKTYILGFNVTSRPILRHG